MSEPSLLGVPGEIRNQVYGYILLLPTLSCHRSLGDPPLHSAILSTCQQIHKEGVQILYGNNTFLAHPSLLTGMPRLRLYYPTISSISLISLITRFHMRVRLDCDPNFTKEHAAKAFSGMDELTVEVFQAQFGGSNYEVLHLFEDIRGVGMARVYGSVTNFPQYTKWLEDSMTSNMGTKRVFVEGGDGDDDTVSAKEAAVEVENSTINYDIWIHGGR